VRTRHPRARAALVACLAATALGVAACSDANEVADLPTIASPAGAPVTDADMASPAADSTPGDTVVATTAGPSTSSTSSASSAPVPVTTVVPGTSTDDGLVGPQFSDALGVRVDGAPGVRTRGDTRKLLDAGLWVHIAWEPDPQDPSVFTVQPDDIPILEAYANAVATYYRAATTTLTTDDPDFAKYFLDSGEKFVEAFDQAQAGGYQLSLGAGVVLRPYIPADQKSPSSALVYDCYLQDQQYFLPTIGEPESGSLETSSTAASMKLVDGEWKIDLSASEQSACL